MVPSKSILRRRFSSEIQDCNCPAELPRSASTKLTLKLTGQAKKCHRKNEAERPFFALDILLFMLAATLLSCLFLSLHMYAGSNSGATEIDDEPWKNYTALQMHNFFGCSEISGGGELPIRNETAYALMRKAYIEVVGMDKSTIGSVLDTSSGFSHPVFVAQSPGMGRGIFAIRDIPKGALVWSNNRTAMFHDGLSYRRFLMKLPYDLACDTLQWTYIHDIGEGTKKRIMVDTDEGGLCNDGDIENNLAWDKEPTRNLFDAGNGVHFFAVRDIKAGEELLCEYSEFSAKYGDWEIFGLTWEY